MQSDLEKDSEKELMFLLCSYLLVSAYFVRPFEKPFIVKTDFKILLYGCLTNENKSKGYFCNFYNYICVKELRYT